jgi:DNA polymerase III alpha subunit (gram-positive type)
MNEHKNSRILVFDVETTGLLPKVDASGNLPTISQYPYVIQFSFLIYNTKFKKIEKTYDYYIDIPKNIEIPDKITELTGINRDLCDKKGVPIVYAIEKFYNEYINCGCVIAHNYVFDNTMIKVELQRNKDKINEVAPYCIDVFSLLFEELNKIRHYCTMRAGTKLCNIDLNTENGKPFKKWPKLSELYYHLFKEMPNGFHNSMIDILVCLRCYLKMRLNMEIINEEFQCLLDKNKK